jgi:hypothetical protein
MMSVHHHVIQHVNGRLTFLVCTSDMFYYSSQGFMSHTSHIKCPDNGSYHPIKVELHKERQDYNTSYSFSMSVL